MPVSVRVFVILLLTCGDANAGWQSCKAITSAEQRLQCYDQYAASLEQQSAKESKADFGLTPTFAAETIDKIENTISRIDRGTRGRRIISLKNNQVWIQVGSSSQPRLAQGDRVRIERGALGSFVLKKNGSNRSLRVKRLK